MIMYNITIIYIWSKILVLLTLTYSGKMKFRSFKYQKSWEVHLTQKESKKHVIYMQRKGPQARTTNQTS